MAVALRKESVDRNAYVQNTIIRTCWSLSARRAWIEIGLVDDALHVNPRRSPQGERG